eukprot:TRINITY_DN101695_c0_g1_i1.p1 TRINITY_DN101695_c0_g1~~TRINITY_DN101695_c0_g1_i1.p1  ORF type:complete len:749 (+),score=162.82 TRINITY_DN101695_c0_g1_i1:120-2366(+)
MQGFVEKLSSAAKSDDEIAKSPSGQSRKSGVARASKAQRAQRLQERLNNLMPKQAFDTYRCPGGVMVAGSVSAMARRSMSTVSDAVSGSCSTAASRLCLFLVGSSRFDTFIGFCIILNSLNSGLEQSLRLAGEDTWFLEVVETCFLGIYTAELVMRFFAYGVRVSLGDTWIRVDALLVGVSLFFTLILEPISKHVDGVPQGFQLNILRTARLFRLARLVRLIIKFRALWMLVQGLINSASTMCYTMIILVTITYIFGCLAMDLLVEHESAKGPAADARFAEIVDANFSNLGYSMLTLVRFVTFDSISSVYTPLIAKDPALALYFMAVLTSLGIVLMNLITAVVVNGALEQANQDREARAHWDRQRRSRMLKEVQSIFHELDEDHSGQINRAELSQIGEKELELLQSLVRLDDPMEIFDLLDVDGSGEIDLHEFCKGLENNLEDKAHVHFQRLDKRLLTLRADLETFTEERYKQFGLIQRELRSIRRALGADSDDEEDGQQAAEAVSSMFGTSVQKTWSAMTSLPSPQWRPPDAPPRPPAWADDFKKSIESELRTMTEALKELASSDGVRLSVTAILDRLGEPTPNLNALQEKLATGELQPSLVCAGGAQDLGRSQPKVLDAPLTLGSPKQRGRTSVQRLQEEIDEDDATELRPVEAPRGSIGQKVSLSHSPFVEEGSTPPFAALAATDPFRASCPCSVQPATDMQTTTEKAGLLEPSVQPSEAGKTQAKKRGIRICNQVMLTEYDATA